MATITLTIPDAQIQRVITAFCANYGYTQSQLPNETQANFTKRMVGLHIQDVVRNYESAQAASTLTVT